MTEGKDKGKKKTLVDTFLMFLFFIQFLGEYSSDSPEIIFDSTLNLEDKGAKPKTSEVK